MPRLLSVALATLSVALPTLGSAQQTSPGADEAGSPCAPWRAEELRRTPTEAELRCRYGIRGPGRFGLLSYSDVPVYQPATPMPGTHVVGLPGHAGPWPDESYEAWEWRVHRTRFGPEAQRVHRGLEVLDLEVAVRILRLESRLAAEGITARRRETWRAPERQAFLFQQGRSRPGPLATSTLTSWHSQVDQRGRAAGRAVDFDVPASQMRRFHEIVWRVGLQSFGHDSNDPGHVFLPDQSELPRSELALLRVLPRVPEVTLATGLPVDRRLPDGGRTALRAAALEFASLPFIPHVAPRVSGGRPWLRVVTAVRAAAGAASRLSSRARPASDGDGAPGGPHRSGASEAAIPDQNRDG